MTPKPSDGRFLRRRRAVAWILIILFAAIPWIRINGKPAILLDVMTRKFVFFGTTFRPTDTLLLDQQAVMHADQVLVAPVFLNPGF